MALTRWILALCGYARLEVCGVHPERVLNACAAAGIAGTASEPVDAYTLRITVRARCAETAVELARQCQCEVKTLYRRGLPQLLRRAVRYRGACAGLLVAVLAEEPPQAARETAIPVAIAAAMILLFFMLLVSS